MCLTQNYLDLITLVVCSLVFSVSVIIAGFKGATSKGRVGVAYGRVDGTVITFISCLFLIFTCSTISFSISWFHLFFI